MIALVFAASVAIGSQTQDDAVLRDRVAQLVERIGNDEAPEDRDAAEAALVKLGAKALPLLPELDESAPEELKARIAKIREQITEADESKPSEASRVTIEGGPKRLSEILRELQRQSGNRITDMRAEYGEEATNPTLDLEIRDLPFFEAFDRVADAAGLAPEFLTGNGSVGLMPGGYGMMDEDAEPAAPATPSVGPFVTYPGPFRVQLERIGISRDLASGLARANLEFRIAWEPKLRPMLLKVDSDAIAIQDDRGEVVAPEVSEESASIILRPENPVVEWNLNLSAPDREAKALASVKVRGEVTVPAALDRFQFDDLAEGGQTVEKGGITVTLVGTAFDSTLWKARLKITTPQGGGAMESYQQGLFNSQIWLQRADGSRFEHNGGFNFLNSGPGELAYEYLFVDVPGRPEDYDLVYEAPGKIVTIPIEFELTDVPLP